MKFTLFAAYVFLLAIGLSTSFSAIPSTVCQSIPPQEPALIRPVFNQQLADAERVVESAFRVFLGDQSGTAFVVQGAAQNELFLVTAGHTFKKSTLKEAKIVVRDKDGQRKELNISVRDKKGEPLWKAHPKYDIAALKIEPNHPFSEFRFLAKQLLSDEDFKANLAGVGTDCMIPCFPAKLESTSSGYPVLRKGSIASHPVDPATNPTFLLDYHSYGGDSGAPVVASIKRTPESQRELVVVGLVFAQTRQTDKSVTAFEERTTHTPIGLGIAVNAKFILETIRGQ